MEKPQSVQKTAADVQRNEQQWLQRIEKAESFQFNNASQDWPQAELFFVSSASKVCGRKMF